MVYNHSYADRYREVAIKTANPLQLVVILYDAAIQSLQEALEHLKSNNISARARSLNKTVAIITELQASLNFDVGGDIAGSLDRLYTYMKQRIFKANVEQAAEPLAEVITLLENLRSAWREVAGQSGGNAAEAGTSPAAAQAIPTHAGPPSILASSLNVSG
jgi:flagellar secretion chaperone FliS